MPSELQDKINIIITHKGNPTYLKFVLAQLKETNPDANIVLMGDSSNNEYPFVKHVMLEDYFHGAKEFEKVYQHKNITPYGFELFCYQRWFCVYEYMLENNLKDVISLDSDVLVYDNLQELYEFVNRFKFSVRTTAFPDNSFGDAGPPLAYFKIEKLKDLCDFFIESYKNPNYLELLDKKVDYQRNLYESVCGICDMNQVYFFTKMQSEGDYFDLSNIIELNNKKIKIDSTILDSTEFEEKDKHKNIQIINKKAYALLKNINEMIEFPLIHFQGYCPVNIKKWIPDYYIGKKYKLALLNRKFSKLFDVMLNKIRKQIFLRKKCKGWKGNVIIFPKNIRFVRKLKINITGNNNIIDLSSVERISKSSIIKIEGDNNVLNFGNLKTSKNAHFDITICGSNSKLDLQGSVLIDELLSIFMCNGTSVCVGEKTSFFKTFIQCIHEGTSVQIGKDCMFSFDIYLYNSDGHPIVNKDNKIVNKPGDIIIGNHVWVGWGASLLKGVCVNNNSIIGRSSVVSKSFSEENLIIAGNPAVKVKTLDGTWLRENESFTKEDM